MKSHFAYCLVILITAFSGCRKNDEQPEANPVVVIDHPTLEDNLVLNPGATFNLEGQAEGEGEVVHLFYSVEILQEADTEGVPWEISLTRVPDFETGRNVQFDFEVEVPENARTGNYQITVIAHDKNGNTGFDQTEVFIITEPDEQD